MTATELLTDISKKLSSLTQLEKVNNQIWASAKVITHKTGLHRTQLEKLWACGSIRKTTVMPNNPTACIRYSLSDLQELLEKQALNPEHANKLEELTEPVQDAVLPPKIKTTKCPICDTQNTTTAKMCIGCGNKM